MHFLVYISCVFAATLLAVYGSTARCSKDCVCTNHCVVGHVSLSDDNSFACESCEDESSDGGIDSVAVESVDSSPNHCSKDCDCINHCVDGEIGLCNNNSCECESCEDESSDGDSDSDAEDGAVHTPWTSCTNDRDCKCVSCPKNEIGFCKDDSESSNKRMCGCKSCLNNESSEDDYSDDSSSSHNVAGGY